MGSILEEMHRMKIQSAVDHLEKSGGNKNVPEHQLDGVYVCKVCGYIYEEAKEGRPFTTLSHCPVCNVGQQQFVRQN